MTIDAKHYDVIVAPVITEKATTVSEHNKVVFKVATNRFWKWVSRATPRLNAVIHRLGGLLV